MFIDTCHILSCTLPLSIMIAPSSIPAFEYEPSAYAFSGVAFNQLPLLAQHYLINIVGDTSPTQWDEEKAATICANRTTLIQTFFRAVQGNDDALVTAWRAAKRLGPEAYQQRSAVLGPERKRHYDDFVTEFDALIWLELESRIASGEKIGPENQQKYRNVDCRLLEALRQRSEMLRALDADVAEKLQSMQASPVKAYFEECVFATQTTGPLAGPGEQASSGESNHRWTSGRRWENSRMQKSLGETEVLSSPSGTKVASETTRRNCKPRSRCSARFKPSQPSLSETSQNHRPRQEHVVSRVLARSTRGNPAYEGRECAVSTWRKAGPTRR